MADIFISYARHDRDKIEKLATALEREGYAVWWDRHIAGGAEYSKDIEAALNDAKAAIVAWSKDSVESRWVKDEAVTAADDGKLIPVCLDGTGAPMGFKQFHVIDLAHWNGAVDAPGFQDLVRAVAAKVRGESLSAPAHVKASLTSKLFKPLPMAAIAAVAVAIIAAAVMLRPSADATGANTEAAQTISEKSIAVLPFVDMSAAGDQEFFADGVSEEILNLLAKSSELKVAGRTSSFAFKGRNEDLRGIGEALGVAHILEGSVRKSGDRLRITAQLIRSSDGFHLWSETYDRNLNDIFVVQEDIAKAIAKELRASLGIADGAHADARTSNLEAYEHYLLGMAHYAERGENLFTAIDEFEKAVQLDPDFAAAWAGLATTRFILPGWFLERDGEPLDLRIILAHARYAALRANDLQPELADTLHAMNQMYMTDLQWERALDAIMKAYEAAPNSSAILEDVFETLELTGRWEEAFPYAKRLVEVDPTPYHFTVLGYAFWDLRDYDGAREAFRKAVALDPDFPTAYREWAALELELGDLDAAQEILDTNDRIMSEDRLCIQDVIDQFRSPKPDFELCDAYQAVDDILTGGGIFDYAGGGNDTVLDAMEKSVKDGRQVGVININTKLIAGTRTDPRFKKLIRDAGFERFWRERGWPRFCQPLGDDDFECYGDSAS